ncbi:MAG TPA: dienelactone hydrolase family protein [Puia sp.]|nr:dienelactone hydrolase family protein [Puia sp.]
MKTIISVLILVNAFLLHPAAQNSVAVNAGIHSGPRDGYTKQGEFINIQGANRSESRVYAAGPEDAAAGILIVHDFFGITPSTKESVEHLGALGYRTIAVDLYHGKFARSNDSAQILMQAKDRKETDMILNDAIRYLKRPGRKLATIGFSAGGIDAVYANLMDPTLFSGTVVIYAGDYDKIEKAKIENLKSPLLAITGSLDKWAVESALHFLTSEKDKSFELYIYPGADHGYAQPFFLNGKNYNTEATRMTWKITEDFLSRHLQ